MNHDLPFERRLSELLAETAPALDPTVLGSAVLAAAKRTRRRPRWLALATEHPMRVDGRIVVGSPSVRAVSALGLTLLLAMLAIGTAVGGIRLLSPAPDEKPVHGSFTSTGRLREARWEHT